MGADTLSNLGNFVWSIADQLRGVYKPHQYGNVILPMTILRRLDCILEPTRGDAADPRRLGSLAQRRRRLVPPG
ncbi:MAG: type restriction enzyme protein [Mycobacterium sp.]|jgi:type I restriction enzyme M protein|nr:type restriction enzyme protein [Mycobacterium sp.]